MVLILTSLSYVILLYFCVIMYMFFLYCSSENTYYIQSKFIYSFKFIGHPAPMSGILN